MNNTKQLYMHHFPIMKSNKPPLKQIAPFSVTVSFFKIKKERLKIFPFLIYVMI